MADDRPRQLWDRTDAETDSAYRAFLDYLNAGTGRRIADAGKASKNGGKASKGVRASGQIVKWSVQHRWVMRSAAYDAHRAMVEVKAQEAVAERNAVTQAELVNTRFNERAESLWLYYNDVIDEFTSLRQDKVNGNRIGLETIEKMGRVLEIAEPFASRYFGIVAPALAIAGSQGQVNNQITVEMLESKFTRLRLSSSQEIDLKPASTNGNGHTNGNGNGYSNGNGNGNGHH